MTGVQTCALPISVKAEKEVSDLQDEMTSYLENAEAAESEILTLRQQMKETAGAELLVSQEKAQELLCKCDALEKVIVDLEASTAHQLSNLAMEAASAEDRATAACKELMDVKEVTASEIKSLHEELEKAILQVEELTGALDEAEIIRNEEREASAECIELKNEEVKQLFVQIDLLKKEVEYAHDCLEAEIQLQEDRQLQNQAEIVELQARLAIAAQELTVQQKSIDQMIAEEKERVSVGVTDDQDALMVEMNALLESKIEAETDRKSVV